MNSDFKRLAMVSLDMVGFSAIRSIVPSYLRDACLHASSRIVDLLVTEAIAQTVQPVRGHRLGDGHLLAFESIGDAESFAFSFQHGVAQYNQGLDRRDPPLRFRVGIAVGDVVLSSLANPNDPYSDAAWADGEATVVATRIERDAQPGNIAIAAAASGTLLAEVRAKYKDAFTIPGKPHDDPIAVIELKEPVYKPSAGMTSTMVHSSHWLRGEVAGWTSIAQVETDPKATHYRGRPISFWLDKSFEEVAYALINGTHYDIDKIREFSTSLRSNREVDPVVRKFIDSFAHDPNRHPMDILRSAVSVAGTISPDSSDTRDDAIQDKIVRAIAQMPTIIGRIARASGDLSSAMPKPESAADHATYCTQCLLGMEATQPQVNLLRKCLILYAEHGFAVSTFAARVVMSARPDLYDSLVAAIGALRGIKHGGASEVIMHDIIAHDNPKKRMSEWAQRVPGWGHPLLMGDDPRVNLLEAAMDEYEQQHADHNTTSLLRRYREYKEVIARNSDITKHGLRPNLEFPAAAALKMIGLKSKYATTVFAIGRSAGWCAHIREHAISGRLIRPKAVYEPSIVSEAD